jgi:putative sterol carrier protein
MRFANHNYRTGASCAASGGKKMKRLATLMVLVLGSVMLYGQQSEKSQPQQSQQESQQQSMEMSGTICSSKCVVQQGGKSACDTSCKEKGGDAVLVGESGNVTKIANPDKVKGFMGKKVKTKGKMMKDDMMMVDYVSIYG